MGLTRLDPFIWTRLYVGLIRLLYVGGQLYPAEIHCVAKGDKGLNLDVLIKNVE